MPAKAPKPQDVTAFLAALEHPFKAEILELRRIILAAAPGVAEEIKWNAPSFRTTGDFATFQLRAAGGVQVILHFGAKKRDMSGLEIADPSNLLEWLGPDRATIKFRDSADIAAKRDDFNNLLRQWIAQI